MCCHQRGAKENAYSQQVKYLDIINGETSKGAWLPDEQMLKETSSLPSICQSK